MTYDDAVEHLYSLGQELAVPVGGVRRKFDLAHMRTLMEALGNPQSNVPAILIAGTNGKGSTAATLASMLRSAGYRTGLYTSPHLNRVNERIQLAQATLPSEYGSMGVHGTEGPLALLEISNSEFAGLYSRIWSASEMLVRNEKLPYAPSFFELLTALAFVWFAERRAEIMVLEVGLGGRLDATNIVEPLLSVITDIALDHQEYLGTTLTEITGEKCGILRRNGKLVTLPQHPEVNQAIGMAATELGVEAVNAAVYVPAPLRGDTAKAGSGLLLRNCYEIREDGGNTIHVESNLAGQHQQRNIALAIAAALMLRNEFSYNIPLTAIEAGIRETVWPGRLEVLGGNVILDVAHNPAGAWTLRSVIAALPEEMPRTLLFSCLRDKDLVEISRILFPLFDSSLDCPARRRLDRIIFAALRTPRSATVENLMNAARGLGIPADAAPSVSAALAHARAATPAGGVVVVTGSVYLVGEVRELLLNGVPELMER